MGTYERYEGGLFENRKKKPQRQTLNLKRLLETEMGDREGRREFCNRPRDHFSVFYQPDCPVNQPLCLSSGDKYTSKGSNIQDRTHCWGSSSCISLGRFSL